MMRRECIGLHRVRWLMRFDSFDVIQCGSPFTLGVYTWFVSSLLLWILNENKILNLMKIPKLTFTFFNFRKDFRPMYSSAASHFIYLPMCVFSVSHCNPYPVCLHCILRKDSYPSNPCRTFASPFHISSLLSVLCSFENLFQLKWFDYACSRI